MSADNRVKREIIFPCISPINSIKKPQCCKQNITIKRTTGCMLGGMRLFLSQP